MKATKKVPSKVEGHQEREVVSFATIRSRPNVKVLIFFYYWEGSQGDQEAHTRPGWSPSTGLVSFHPGSGLGSVLGGAPIQPLSSRLWPLRPYRREYPSWRTDRGRRPTRPTVGWNGRRLLSNQVPQQNQVGGGRYKIWNGYQSPGAGAPRYEFPC